MKIRRVNLYRAHRLDGYDFGKWLDRKIIEENHKNRMYHSLRITLPLCPEGYSKIGFNLVKSKLRKLNKYVTDMDVTIDFTIGVINVTWIK